MKNDFTHFVILNKATKNIHFSLNDYYFGMLDDTKRKQQKPRF